MEACVRVCWSKFFFCPLAFKNRILGLIKTHSTPLAQEKIEALVAPSRGRVAVAFLQKGTLSFDK
jgi:hypothetical protein